MGSSGKQVAEQNYQLFCSWVARKSVGDFKQMVSRGVLSRKEIAKECGFAKSALDQNPRIKAALLALELELRTKGILPALASPSFSDKGSSKSTMPSNRQLLADTERLRRLEHQVAILQAENTELKRQLEKYAVLSEALASAGRLPR